MVPKRMVLISSFNFSDYNQIEDGELEASPISNGRENFITSHRIPLELFPKETLRRIELISDELVAPVGDETTTQKTTTENNSYVESKSFRVEPTLTVETDTQFESTVDKFVPDDY